jgi:hypothetical protein
MNKGELHARLYEEYVLGLEPLEDELLDLEGSEDWDWPSPDDDWYCGNDEGWDDDLDWDEENFYDDWRMEDEWQDLNCEDWLIEDEWDDLYDELDAIDEKYNRLWREAGY